jgi:hypothetical protein
MAVTILHLHVQYLLSRYYKVSVLDHIKLYKLWQHFWDFQILWGYKEGYKYCNLQTTSIRPSPKADVNWGLSADTSHRYIPLDFRFTPFRATCLSFDKWCCNTRTQHLRRKAVQHKTHLRRMEIQHRNTLADGDAKQEHTFRRWKYSSRTQHSEHLELHSKAHPTQVGMQNVCVYLRM